MSLYRDVAGKPLIFDMRKILTLTLILVYQGVSGQGTKKEDALNIRILNKGKHYIKEYTLTIDGKNYTKKEVG